MRSWRFEDVRGGERIEVQRHPAIDRARVCAQRQIIGRLGRHWRRRSPAAARNLNRSIEMTTETAGMPTIDMRSISQLAEGDEDGDRFVAEIIDVFLADLSERVRAIALQMNQNDCAGVAATAHAIKGSCGHFGAARLTELCRDLEERARREPTFDIQPAISLMIAEAEQVREALEAYKSDHARP